MRGRARILPALLALCLLPGLCACGGERETAAAETPVPAAIGTPVPEAAVSEPPFDVPAEVADADSGTREFSGGADGLAGRYYNDYLRETLTLDGRGGFRLSGTDADSAGGYTREADGGMTLTLEGAEHTADVDTDGDIRIEGRTGYYLRDWAFWGITEKEAMSGGFRPDEVSVSDNGDGTMRYRDFGNSIAFTYPADMSVLEGKLIGGAAVSDGKGGSVTGRNVTGIYSTQTGSDDEFLADYIRTFVFSDFGLLYEKITGYEQMQLLHEGIEGRLAAATLELTGSSGKMRGKVILYTSTFADGTVNYICKTVFAPAEREDGVEELQSAVTDMGAVRLAKETG